MPLPSSTDFFQINLFPKKFRNTINVSNRLDFVGPDRGPNCLQRLSAGDKNHLYHVRIQEFLSGGSRPDGQKTASWTFFLFFFFSPQLILQFTGGGGGWGPMVLLQRKLLSQGFRRGLQHFPREGGGVRIPYPPSGSAHGYRGKS